MIIGLRDAHRHLIDCSSSARLAAQSVFGIACCRCAENANSAMRGPIR
jgi:hypothetical protein